MSKNLKPIDDLRDQDPEQCIAGTHRIAKRSAHTLAPWTWKEKDEGWIVKYGDNRLEDRGYFSEADARLIAAAPDLLAALKRALPHIPQGEPDFAETLQMATNAIARAEGRKL